MESSDLFVALGLSSSKSDLEKILLGNFELRQTMEILWNI